MTERQGQTVRDIVIVGGGTAGWMSAAALSNALAGTGASIRLIESAEIGTVGVGEATLPQIRYFNQKLGLDEAMVMARTRATIKLGIQFCDWGALGQSYVHPFGNFGETIGLADFHHYWAKENAAGMAAGFGSYSYPVMAALAGRFELPKTNPETPLTDFSYAFQFDASLYAGVLAEYAVNKGVTRTEGKVMSVHRDSESGFITAVVLESGEEISGELFIDCTGFRGLLIEQELQTGYDDWSEYLPCNRAVAVPCEIGQPLGLYTRATAHEGGWQWRIPLQHRIGNGYVYCDQYLDDDAAIVQLMGSLDGPALADPKKLFFKTGKRRQLWNKNCVAIGLSGGFLEPLESTSIDLIQSGIETLIELFPTTDCLASDVGEYNRLMDLEFERIRDFLMLHYVANQREGALWCDMRNMKWPDSLSVKIEAFQRRGLVPKFTQGLFQPASWLSVFIGQNIIPQGWDPRVDMMDDAARTAHLACVKSTIDSAVETTGAHLDFIKAYGARYE